MSAKGKLPPRFTDEEILAMTDKRTFQRGSDYFRGGAVLEPTIGDSVLLANVEGSGAESYQVSVVWENGVFEADCDCPAFDGAFCKHVIAVLLAWSREPASFSGMEAASDNDGALEIVSGDGGNILLGLGISSPEGAFNQLLRMLDERTANDLRQIARRRSIAAKGPSKGELLAQVTDGLLEPDGLRAELAHLGPEERVALDLVHLLAGDGRLGIGMLSRAYAELGIREPEELLGVLNGLQERGLVVGPRSYAQFGVPAGVGAHLPPADYLAKRTARPSPATRLAMLPFDELIFHVWRHLRSNSCCARPSEGRSLADKTNEVLRGWYNDPGEVALFKGQRGYAQRENMLLTSLPPPPALADPDIERLAPLAGGNREAIDLAFHVLRAEGLVTGKDRFAAQEAPLRQFLRESPGIRRQGLALAWLRRAAWDELAQVLRREKRLRLRRRVQPYTPLHPDDLGKRFSEARQLLVRMLLRLEEGVWYDLAPLANSFRCLGTALTVCDSRYSRESEPDWRVDWQGDAGRKQQDPEIWALVWRRMVAAVLGGPLTWFGVATLAESAGVEVFQINGLRALLAGEEGAAASAIGTVSEDMSVVVPAGSGDLSAHEFLLSVAVPAEATPAGLRYRLTAETVRAAFEAGVDAPAILGFLDQLAHGGVPARVRATLRDWSQRYGAVRLYAGCALLELADDYTLPELLTSTRLAGHLVYQFSPRLIAVDPATCDNLIDELVRKGYTPKVAESGR